MSLLDDPARLAARAADRRASFPMQDMRRAFGATMLALAEEYPQLVAVTADLTYATGMAPFAERHPRRLINVGIAEQNMTGVAAGLAACGKLPVVCGYAAFTTLRAVEQAKVDCAYNGLRVILVGQSAGLSYGVGGPTHQTFEDVAIMRAIPNMRVVSPSDAVELDRVLRACCEGPEETPVYVRVGRGPEPVFNGPDHRIRIGEAVRLREGRDVLLVAHGAMVVEALIAAEILAHAGIEATVLNAHTIKPFDRDAIRGAAARVRAIVTVEEHGRIGGLGAAVLEATEDLPRGPLARIGIDDLYPPIGPAGALRLHLGLSAETIARVARDLLARAAGA